jgi:uncharacterized membrane protein
MGPADRTPAGVTGGGTGHRRRVSGPRTRSSRAEAIRGGIWLLPTLFAVGAVVLAIVLSVLVPRLALPLGGIIPSGPAVARSLLSSIITAMISFTALVFSITVVAVQLASAQFSPRVLRTFLQDRVTQLTLGTFVSTFLFAMVVLATLPQPGERVPQLSLVVAMALVLASIGVFLHYLHHITTILHVSSVIAAIGAQTRGTIDRLIPASAAPEPGRPTGPVVRSITAETPGVVSDIDLERLAGLARQRRCAISAVAVPGDYVFEGARLLDVHQVDATPPGPLQPGDVHRAVSIGVERTPDRDLGFGFRQLADIAERALAPSVNDLTTAVRAVQEMHDLLRRLAVRPHRARVARDEDGTVRVWQEQPTFGSLLALAIDDVRNSAGDQQRIGRLLETMLRDLESVALPEHLPAVRRGLAVGATRSRTGP